MVARGKKRGFSLIEMMAVVTIIGIVAVVASPTFTWLLRDRQVDAVATGFSDFYRIGRARAMGRGSAIVLTYDNAASLPTPSKRTGHLSMREAVLGPGSPSHAMLPSTSCLRTDWSGASTTSRFVAAFEDRYKRNEPAKSVFLNELGSKVGFVQICYTPRGRSFVRYAAGSAWLPLTGVPQIRVTNTDTDLARFVILPPNGAASVRKQI
jgi:prepilin-type N-terminal cleavage/methylation domain-containing protein